MGNSTSILVPRPGAEVTSSVAPAASARSRMVSMPNERSRREPAEAAPKHFTPADPDVNPTQGWDPFDTEVPHPGGGFTDPIAAAHAAGLIEGRAAADIAADLVAAFDRHCA